MIPAGVPPSGGILAGHSTLAQTKPLLHSGAARRLEASEAHSPRLAGGTGHGMHMPTHPSMYGVIDPSKAKSSWAHEMSPRNATRPQRGDTPVRVVGPVLRAASSAACTIPQPRATRPVIRKEHHPVPGAAMSSSSRHRLTAPPVARATFHQSTFGKMCDHARRAIHRPNTAHTTTSLHGGRRRETSPPENGALLHSWNSCPEPQGFTAKARRSAKSLLLRACATRSER